MADLQKTVEIIFGAVDNTGSGVSSVAKNLGSVADNASNLAAPLGKVADYALKAETAVLSLAAAYGGYAMLKASEFEQAQIDLNKVLSDGDPAISAFTDSAMKLGEQYGISSAAVLQGVANFKQAGFSAQEAADLQKNALDLMIAGDVDAARASDILVSSLKGFGAGAGEATRFIEAMNNVSDDYATDVAQLAEGMSKIAPIAHLMGFSFEEATGLMTPMIEVFGSGSEAAEGLKTGLLKLIDDAKPVREALGSIGVAQTDANGQLRSGKDIFYDVAKAFEHLDEKQKLFLTSQLVGSDQAHRMVLAFNNLAKINEITASAMEETGSVAKEVALRLDSTEQKVKSFASSFDDLAIRLGEKLNAQFSGVIKGSTDVVQSLRAIAESGGMDKFFNALKPLVEELSKTLENIAANLPAAFAKVDFSGFIGALRDMGGEIGHIFDGVDLSTPEGLAKAIQFVVDALESLTRVTSGVVSAWEPVVREFIAGVKAFNDMDDASKKTVGSVSGLGQVFESLKGILTGGFGALDTIGKALTAIAGIKAAETLIGVSGAVKTLEFGSAILSAEKLAVALSFPTIVTAIGAVSFAIGSVGFAVDQNVKSWDDYVDRQKRVEESSENLRLNQSKIADNLDEISKRTGVAVTSMDEFNKAVDSGRLVFNEATGTWDAAKSSVRDYDAEVAKAASSVGDYELAANDVAKSLGLGTEAAEKAAKGFSTLGDAQEYAAQAFGDSNNVTYEQVNGLWKVSESAFGAAEASKELGKSTKDAADAGKEGSQEWKRVQDVMLATQKQTEEFKIKMGELANERYAIDVQANVDLKTAQIEAETQRISAAFTAASDVIASLTESVTSLWIAFGDHAGFKGGDAIADAANRMEGRLDEELQLKREMTQAVVAQATATAQRLASGEPLISIDARELAPELELVFDKILKYTQIRATQQGLSLLVGLQ